MNIDRGHEAGYKVSLSGHDSVSLELPETTPLETRWIFSRLSTVSDSIAHSLADYRFDEAANAVYRFFWGEFCDWYLELVKLRLNFDGLHSDITALTLNALVTVFEAALRLLSPFMPFLTEELWHALYASVGTASPAQSIALTRYPQREDFAADTTSVLAMTTLQDLIVTIRGLRKELAVPEKESTPIQLHASPQISTLVQSNADMLSRLARVSSVESAAATLTGNNARSTSTFDVAILYERQIDVAAERERLTKDLAKYNKGLETADKQLGNEGFIARAPAHIVEGLRKQHAETLGLKQKAEAALAALPAE
jgi:valyl-tRNA synthetase